MRRPPNSRRQLVARSLVLAAVMAVPTLVRAGVPTPYAPPLPPTAPYAGYVNYAHTSPTFHWGWFGADRYAPKARWHRDYNGNVMRWNTLRRY